MALFVETMSPLGAQERYIRAFEKSAQEAMEGASKDHPGYARALELFQQAEVLKAEKHYEDAYDQFQAAAEAFRVCKPYDSSAEERARRARADALAIRPEHRLSVLGEAEWQRGLTARDAADHAAAIEAFTLAAALFEFDDQLERDATAATILANPASPDHAAALKCLQDGRSILAQEELTAEDLATARRLFRAVQRSLAGARPYDESLERVAQAALTAVDPEAPGHDEARAAWERAITHKAAGEYGAAYEEFARVRDLALEQTPAYVPADEQLAQQARQEAAPTSPYFIRGLEAMTRANAARDEGDNAAAYAGYRRARRGFLRAVDYDESPELEATEARVAASAGGGDLELAEKTYRLGYERKVARDYQGAVQCFIQARDLFRESIPYDRSHESAALAARGRANPDVPISYRAGEFAFMKAQAARDDSQYEEAYRLFDEATRQFERACISPMVRRAMQAARDVADPVHLGFAEAFRAERQGHKKWEAGDGAGAAEEWARATMLYTEARRTQDSPGISQPLPVRGNDDPRRDRVEMRARRNAKKARRNAQDQKERCDEWKARGIMNKSTVPSYREGLALWEQAEHAYQARQWNQSEALYDRALATLLLVSNKSR
jgi:hypothetical protein